VVLTDHFDREKNKDRLHGIHLELPKLNTLGLTEFPSLDVGAWEKDSKPPTWGPEGEAKLNFTRAPPLHPQTHQPPASLQRKQQRKGGSAKSSTAGLNILLHTIHILLYLYR
jgi:hypothetical protein